MHASVLDFIRQTLSPSEVKGKRIIEVGSLDVNGSARPMIVSMGPTEYWGVDCWLGPSVDVVCKADDLERTFGLESFDIVLSTEMLEHVEDWRLVISQLKRAVKKGGLLILTTRSPGFPYHPFPIDKWRYTKEDFKAVFRDFEILELRDDPLVAGVFLKARKSMNFSEADLSKINVHVV